MRTVIVAIIVLTLVGCRTEPERKKTEAEATQKPTLLQFRVLRGYNSWGSHYLQITSMNAKPVSVQAVVLNRQHRARPLTSQGFTIIRPPPPRSVSVRHWGSIPRGTMSEPKLLPTPFLLAFGESFMVPTNMEHTKLVEVTITTSDGQHIWRVNEAVFESASPGYRGG